MTTTLLECQFLSHEEQIMCDNIHNYFST